MREENNRLVPAGLHPLRHWGGFLISGGVAFAVDAVVLTILTAILGLHPLAARLLAISAAMVAGWLMHRTVTFAVQAPPSFPEFLRYAGVAWGAAALSYGLFAAIILARRETPPLAALVASSAVTMFFSYLGMRFAAFRRGCSTSK